MLRRNILLLIIVFLLNGVFLVSAQVSAQDNAATTTAELNVRSGPGRDAAVLTKIPLNTIVILQARDEAGAWTLMQTTDGAVRGWIAAAYLELPLGYNLFNLPVSDEQIQATGTVAPAAGAVAGDTSGTTTANLNVRTGPSTSDRRIGTIQFNTLVNVLGRDETTSWLFVQKLDGSLQGWVSISFMRPSVGTNFLTLPVSNASGAVGAATDAEGAPAAPAEAEEHIPLPEELTDFPTVVLNAGNARAIFQRGQRLGNIPNSFIKIGDSNTAGTVFLCPFEWGNYDLGQYGYLQPIIDSFNQTRSFCRDYQTARTGYATANLLDTVWADPAICEAGETPLTCELRLSRPSFALIYIGTADMATTTLSAYQANMGRIIRTLTNAGVVPILTTYPMAEWFDDGKPTGFNQAIRSLARQYRVPLIDLRAAAFDMDNRGTGPDGYHLSVRDAGWTTFTGDELVYGRTLRELLALQVLHDLLASVG